MTSQLRMVNVCAWNMQTSKKNMTIMCTNGVKKTHSTVLLWEVQYKNDAKSKEI